MFPARRGPQIQNKGTFKLKNRQGGGRFFWPLRKIFLKFLEIFPKFGQKFEGSTASSIQPQRVILCSFDRSRRDLQNGERIDQIHWIVFALEQKQN